jgi:ketosteroid isomerase-like protein
MNPEKDQTTGLEETIRAYLDSFEARDLQRCVDYFAEDGLIDFQMSTYRGRKAIEQWHTDRFGADLRINRVESVRVNGDTVTVDAVVSSKRLAAWKMSNLSGRVTVRFESGKIKECKLSPRMGNPIDLIRGEL